MTLTSSDFIGIAGVMFTFLSIPVGLIGFILRAQANRIGAVEREIGNVSEKLVGRVTHEDWVRTVASHEHRQDEIVATLANMGGKLDATIGLTGGLQRLAGAIERQTEQARHGG